MPINTPNGLVARPALIQALSQALKVPSSAIAFSDTVKSLNDIQVIHHVGTAMSWFIPTITDEIVMSFNPPMLVTDKQSLNLTQFNVERGNFQKRSQYSFVKGFTVYHGLETVVYNGIEYRWTKSFPKVVVAGSVPGDGWLNDELAKDGDARGFGLVESVPDASVILNAIVNKGVKNIYIKGIETLNMMKGVQIPSNTNLYIYGNPTILYSEMREATSFSSQYIGAFEMVGSTTTTESKLAVNAAVSSRFLTVDNGAIFRPGDSIILSQDVAAVMDTSSYARQLLKVIQVSGDTLTLESELCYNYTVDNNAKVTVVIPCENSNIYGDFTCKHETSRDLRSPTILIMRARNCHHHGMVTSEKFGGNSVTVEDSFNITTDRILGLSPSNVTSGRGNTLVLKSVSVFKFNRAYGLNNRHVCDLASGTSVVQGRSVTLNSTTASGNALNGHGMNSHSVIIDAVEAFGGEVAVSLGNASYKSDYDWQVGSIRTSGSPAALGVYLGSQNLTVGKIDSVNPSGLYVVNIIGEGTGGVTLDQINIKGGVITYGVTIDSKASGVNINQMDLVGTVAESGVRLAREAKGVIINKLRTDRATVKRPVSVEAIATSDNFDVQLVVKSSNLYSSDEYSVLVGGVAGGGVTTPTGIQLQGCVCNRPLRLQSNSKVYLLNNQLSGVSSLSSLLTNAMIIGNYGGGFNQSPAGNSVVFSNNISPPQQVATYYLPINPTGPTF